MILQEKNMKQLLFFPTTVDYREYLREFPIYFFFFVQAKMGDNYDIWQETGQLASCCTSIYSFLSIWFPDSLNICKILFSEISDTLIISFSVLMKVLEIYDKKILQIFYESVNKDFLL